MGRRPSDQEFKLAREIKELKEQNHKLEDEIKKLKKQAEKTQPKEDKKKPGKPIAKPCPDCGAEVKTTDLPHATMELCSAGCGFRNVRSKK
jgi:hypothetical protein